MSNPQTAQPAADAQAAQPAAPDAAAPAPQPRKPWRAPTVEQVPLDQTLAGPIVPGGVDGGFYSSLVL